MLICQDFALEVFEIIDSNAEEIECILHDNDELRQISIIFR